MNHNNGTVIQGSFIGGHPRVTGVALPPAIQTQTAGGSPIQPRMPAPSLGQWQPHANRPAAGISPPNAQSRARFPNTNQHAARFPGVAQPNAAQLQGLHPQAVQARSAASNGQAPHRTGNEKAFLLPANLSNFGGGSGEPLPHPVRQKMESFFNTSFADVRVHVGTQAASIGALAFTQGSNLYFASGHYNPSTMQGQQLLGHELAHVVQQRAGRVRNQFGSGVAVVQDGGLEAEAARLGMSAALHQGPVQARTAGVQAYQLKTAPREMQGPRFGPRPSTVQPTIYKFKEGKSGKSGKWEVAELGTKGSFKLPTDGAKGKYFNDVTGTSGKSRREVRAGLADLMMITGSLKDEKVNVPWPRDVWDDLMKGAEHYGPYDIKILGTVTLAWGKDAQFAPHDGDVTQLLPKLWKTFLCPFMEKNGQLPYIRRQSWFKKGEAVVDIDLNFYPSRGYSSTQLDFHKDTAGDNLFVNLVFNNEKATPATEWVEDLATPLTQKREEMRRLMPAGMRSKIRAARKRMRGGTAKPEGMRTIRGGTAEPFAFVSWVDELVWHATPYAGSRRDAIPKNTVEILSDPAWYWVGKLGIHRGLRSLVMYRDTLIAEEYAKWKQAHKQGFDTNFVDSYMEQVVAQESVVYLEAENRIESYRKGPQFGRHMADVEKHKAEISAAPIPLWIGQEVAPDPRGTGAAEYNQRTRIHRRTQRANSSRNLSEAVAKAKSDNETRSFLRTWVRVRKVKQQ